MMRRRRWRSFALLATITLVAAACGGDGDGGGDGGQGFEGEDLSGQTIEVAAIWGEDTGEAQAFAQVIDLFEQQTGATVEYTSTGDDLPTVIGGRIAGGDPPDVAMVGQPGTIADFAAQDALVPLDGTPAADALDANYEASWRELGSVDGTLYAIYFKATNKATVWYNLNVFNDAGVSPPATWEEFLSTAQTISDSGVPPFAIDGASGWVLSDWFENIYLRTAGADMYDQLASHEIPWTDPSVTDALTRMGEVVQSDLLAGGTDGTLQSEFPNSVTVAWADPPGAAIVAEGDFVGGVITTETSGTLGTDADFFEFPAIDGSPSSSVISGDAAVLFNDTPAGQAFIEFLATPDAAAVWAALGGFTSPNKALDPGVYPDEIAARWNEQLANAEAVRFDLSDLQPAAFGATAGQGIWGLLQEFVRNPSDVDGTAQALEDEAAAAFG
jgi:ABC-type glycerol-3-phosphate transport system substrate-binding protein